VRSRAATGAALLGARGTLIYVFGIGANLALARLLVPRDFGIVALGTVMVVIGSYVAGAGFGAALIQRDRPPERIELEAVLGLQLAATGGLAALVAAVAAGFGRDGLVVAAMVASLPVAMLRIPPMIVFERQLQYRVIATADVLEALCYYVWALGTVAVGFGVWGLATAVVVRAIAGSATLIVRGPLGFVRPRWSWPHVRPLLGFGLKFQSAGLLQVLQQQGLNVGVAAVGGVAALGGWNLAWRVLQVPILVFVEVNRVAFPSMSRLIDSGEEVRLVIERAVATLAALTGVLTVALVGFAPFLPTLVGSDWSEVPQVLFWSGIALTVGVPITVATSGYLLAVGAAGKVAIATVASSVVWFGLALPLLPSLGLKAIGIGWVVAIAVYVGMLWRATASHSGAAIGERVAVPTALALVATVASWLIADSAPESLLAAAAGALAGEALLVAGLAVLRPAVLRSTRSIVARALGR
jgi:O-antigen/teichoic acid export membrane protein